jgi:MFS family permease
MQYSRRYEIAMVVIMFLTWGTVFLDRMAQLYLAPFFAAELNLNAEQIGILASTLALTWALSSFAFGAISDRVGRRPVLIPMVFAFSLLSWVSGVARNFQQMLLVRGAMGVAEGPCWSVMNAVVEQSSHPARRGRNVGIVISAAAAIGLALAPVLTTQVAARWGWRTAFFVAGMPGLFMGFLIWKFIKEPPAVRDSGSSEPLHNKASLRDIMQILRYRNLWLCAAANAGFVTWLILQNAFGPLYMTEVAHQAPTTAGFLLGAAGVGSFVVGMLFPILSDKVGRKPILMLSAVMSVFLPLAIWYLPLYEHIWLLALILAFTQGGQAMASLAMVLIPTESVPRHLAATAIGFTTLVGEIAGSVIAPAVAGTLAKAHGLELTLFIASGGAILVLAAGALLRETVARVQPAAQQMTTP